MKYVLFVIALLVLVAGGVFYYNKNLVLQTIGMATVADFKNISYQIDGQDVKLVNGAAEMPIVDSSSKTVTKYFGNEVWGDFNGDGIQDVAFVLTQTSGGSGTFFYAVAALGTGNGYVGTNAVLMGDRVSPQSATFGDGIIVVNYSTRGVDDAMMVPPSVGASLRLQIAGGKLVKI
jgi:hypothetical protein